MNDRTWCHFPLCAHPPRLIEAIFRRDVRLLVKADGTETVQPRSRLIIAKEYLTGARLHAEIRSRPSFDEVFHCQSVPVDFGEGVAQDTGGSVTEESHCNDDKNDGDDDDDDDEQRAEHDHRRLSMARDTLADMELFAVVGLGGVAYG